jgi:hypothetical protein
MRTMRPAIAIDARSFGKRFVLHDAAVVDRTWRLGTEVRLFAATFLAGFVFVSVLLA